MMEIEQVYTMQSYLNNLLMFKCLYDERIDISLFHKCRLSSYSEYSGMDDHSFYNFDVIANHLFEQVSFYSEHYDAQANVFENQKHWLQAAHIPIKSSDTLMVAVILDPSLSDVQTGYVGTSIFSGESAEMFQVENGVVIVYDTDYGEPDWCDIMVSLLYSRRCGLSKEDKLNEMAI